VLYAHKLPDALLKKPVAVKVLVCSRGRLTTLKILTSSIFSGWRLSSSGQCVYFSLIDVGSDFTAYVDILFSVTELFSDSPTRFPIQNTLTSIKTLSNPCTASMPQSTELVSPAWLPSWNSWLMCPEPQLQRASKQHCDMQKCWTRRAGTDFSFALSFWAVVSNV